jgi:hypothetical protein
MDSNFEFSMGAAHQTPTTEDIPTTRTVCSAFGPHGSGKSSYKFGYVNDVRPCPVCKGSVYGN